MIAFWFYVPQAVIVVNTEMMNCETSDRDNSLRIGKKNLRLTKTKE